MGKGYYRYILEDEVVRMQKLRIEKKLKVRLMEIAIVIIIISYRPRVTDVIGQVSIGNRNIGIWKY